MSNQIKKVNLPKFSILEVRRNDSQYCDACGAYIKHVYVVRDNETKDQLMLGSGCVKSHTGKTAKEIYSEEKQYKAYLQAVDLYENAQIRVKTYQEANPEIIAYLEANQDNSFCKAMIEMIESTGSLTTAQYATVYSMMIPVAELPEKVIGLEVRPLRAKETETMYGYTTTVYCETKNHELVRLHFSSINDNNKKVLDYSGVFTKGNDINKEVILADDNWFTASGSFDGYKIKRCKLK